MIDYQYLILQNPWWENKYAIKEDEKIKEFSRLKFKYIPKALLSIKPVGGDIHVISGPRQTGKSTALKLYIKNALESGVPPRKIFYFNCDAISTTKELIDLIINFNEAKSQEKALIFLDEISSVENWPKGIKWLVDSNQLKNATLFLTGSSSINLKKSGEMLPGRRGRGKDIAFLPIDFYEYLNVKKIPIKQIELKDFDNTVEISRLSQFLRPHYQDFILSGGFLRNINYGLTYETLSLYVETLRSELFKNGKKEDSLREVLRKLINSLSSQTSYTNIAEEAELGSKNTAIDYLAFLENSYFIKEVKFYDIAQQKIILKKNKKFYTSDPYFVWLFQVFVFGVTNIWALKNRFDNSKLAENFVATELVKKSKTFYFYQNSKELDFYLPEGNIGIEVKYKPKITSDDAKFPPTLRRKILVSQNTIERRNEVFILPVWLFPLLQF